MIVFIAIAMGENMRTEDEAEMIELAQTLADAISKDFRPMGDLFPIKAHVIEDRGTNMRILSHLGEKLTGEKLLPI